MTGFMRDDQFLALSQLLERELGISQRYLGRDALGKKLKKRLIDLKMNSLDEYTHFLRNSRPSWKELGHLAAYVLNMESFFLREMPQFTLLVKLLRELQGKRKDAHDQTIRLLSAGCSYGEEPYSLAIVLQESGLPFPGWNLQIIGTDIDPGVLLKAEHGIFHAYTLRGVEEKIIDRYFLNIGRDSYRLVPSLLRRVSFRQANLLHPLPFEPDCLDIVFCRNVLLYMTENATEKIIGNIWKSLRPDGFLFIGQSEILRRPGKFFEPVKYPDVTVYRKRSD